MTIRKKFKPSISLCLITVSLVSFLGLINGNTKEETVAAPVNFVVISDTFDNPDFAKVLLCESYANSGIVINVKTTEGKKEQLMTKDVKQVVEIPNLRSDLVQPFQFDAINSCLEELTKITKTYPRLRGSLLPLGKEMMTIVDSGAQGLVRRSGKWEKAAAPTTAPNIVGTGLVIREISGKEYRNAKIKRVDPDGLMVMHESGLSKVLFLNLSNELREKYGYDPEKSAAFSDKKAANQAAIRQRMALESNRLELAKQQQMREQQQASAFQPSRKQQNSSTLQQSTGKWVATNEYTPEFQDLMNKALAVAGGRRGGGSDHHAGAVYTKGRFKGKSKAQLIEIVKLEYRKSYPGKSYYVLRLATSSSAPSPSSSNIEVLRKEVESLELEVKALSYEITALSASDDLDNTQKFVAAQVKKKAKSELLALKKQQLRAALGR